MPWPSLVLGYGAMVPFVAAAGAVVVGEGTTRALGFMVMVLWGSALLLFLAGVRRGLSFRTPGGPTRAQIAMTLWLFLLGLAAPMLPVGPALLILTAGFLSLAVMDPAAARRGEVPPFFARLRPPQMAIPIGCLLVGLIDLVLPLLRG